MHNDGYFNLRFPLTLSILCGFYDKDYFQTAVSALLKHLLPPSLILTVLLFKVSTMSNVFLRLHATAHIQVEIGFCVAVLVSYKFVLGL